VYGVAVDRAVDRVDGRLGRQWRVPQISSWAGSLRHVGVARDDGYFWASSVNSAIGLAKLHY
jgi:hypothetical protein